MSSVSRFVSIISKYFYFPKTAEYQLKMSLNNSSSINTSDAYDKEDRRISRTDMNMLIMNYLVTGKCNGIYVITIIILCLTEPLPFDNDC